MFHERILVCEGVAHRVPLRKLSNKPQSSLDLHGADLSGNDLRSLDLNGADLRFADLRRVRTGLNLAARARLGLFAILLAVGGGVLSGFAGQWLGVAFGSRSLLEHWIGITVAAELLLFLSAALWRGLGFAVRTVLLPVSAAAFLVSLIGLMTGKTGAAGGAVIAFSALVFALITLATLARTLAHSTGLLLLLLVALSGSLVGRALHGGLVSTSLAVAAFVLARRTSRGDPELPYLTRLSRRIACAGGTSLRNADLRGARLAHCQLVCTDLRGARLDGAELTGASEFMCSLDPAQSSLLALGVGERARQSE
jgi:hypothetical protein